MTAAYVAWWSIAVDLKERIYAERGELQGVHIIDVVDILAAENATTTHVTVLPACHIL